MANVRGTIIVTKTMTKILMNVLGSEVCSEIRFHNGEPPHHP